MSSQKSKREFVDPFTAEIKLLNSLKNVKYKQKKKLYKSSKHNKKKTNQQQTTKHEWKTYLPGFITDEPKQTKKEKEYEKKLYEMESRKLSYNIKPEKPSNNKSIKIVNDTTLANITKKLPFNILKSKKNAFQNSQTIKSLLSNQRQKHLKCEDDYKEIKIAVVKELESEITLTTKILKDDIDVLNDLLNNIILKDNKNLNEIENWLKLVKNNFFARNELYQKYLKQTKLIEEKRKNLLEQELVRLVKRLNDIGHKLLPEIQKDLIDEVFQINKEILRNEGYYFELITKLKIDDLENKHKYIDLAENYKSELEKEALENSENEKQPNEQNDEKNDAI